MTFTDDELSVLADVATGAARRAGRFIADSRPDGIEYKAGSTSLASSVVTEIDRAAEQLILEVLEPTLAPHGLALLTEEQVDDGGRHRRPAFWCIDPLDGTLPFVEGRPGYAVSIALVDRSGTSLLGVVQRPTDGALYRAIRGQGATKNGAPLAPPVPGTSLHVYVDRSFATFELREVMIRDLEALSADVGLRDVSIHAGHGGVLNACGVIEHAPACYVKLPRPTLGGASVWDFAATACIGLEAGIFVGDVYGNALDLNRKDSSFMNHRGVIYASSAALGRALIACCAKWSARLD